MPSPTVKAEITELQKKIMNSSVIAPSCCLRTSVVRFKLLLLLPFLTHTCLVFKHAIFENKILKAYFMNDLHKDI